VRENLRAVSNSTSAETERRVGALQARLEFGLPEEMAPERLPAYLTTVVEQLALIGAGIARDFLVPAEEPVRAVAPVAEARQHQ
jgi:hypothetical protein